MQAIKRRKRQQFLACMALALALVVPATAEVKDYQIRRMLMLKTECQVVGLDIETLEQGKGRFLAACENVSHYPDGVEILCPDTEDERECRIVTVKREFRHLESLRP